MHPIRIRAWRCLCGATAVVLATGCATGGGYARSVIAPGSVVTLHEPLRMPTGEARVYIQGGRPIAHGDINEFRPFCSFGLERKGGEALVDVIRPGRFDVVRRAHSWAAAAAARRNGVRVAANGTLALRGSFEGGGPERYTVYTELKLSALEQPQVDDLRCQYDRVDWIVRYPTLEEMQATLGGLATIRPAPGS